MALTSGARFSPYEVIAPIGAGGMGEVYRARDTRLDRIVAIKVLRSPLAADPDLKLRFEREARALSSLNHPHICTLHDIGNQDGVVFLVMEYLEGETLAHRLRKGRLAFDQALQIGVEVGDALDKAHRHGIIHRDLKPGNIMLVKAGAKLMDFGLAKPVQKVLAVASGPATPTISESLTAKGTIIGTLQYMAPEQLQGEEADSRSDIFALGAVLYEMLTGRPAFAGKNPASIIAVILTFDPLPVGQLQPMSPPILEHALNRALAKDPDQRWQTAQDFAGELRWIMEGAGRASPTISSIRRWSWRELVGWGVAAAIIAALLSFRAQRNLPTSPVRFQITTPEGVDLPLATVSPDGCRLAITDDDGGQVWIRELDSFVARTLPNTDGAPFSGRPTAAISCSPQVGSCAKC
jgi:eukaryotic-like serine/threonine-protein kinase